MEICCVVDFSDCNRLKLVVLTRYPENIMCIGY